MQEKELEILEHLHQDTSLHQRDLSRIVGLSLGMTNAILKRLAMKGFLMVKKVNNRNIKYIVSPAGVEEISKRSYHYFKRTIKNIVYYKENLEHTLRRLKEQGVMRILLEGESDVDFIIEHLCTKIGLPFSRCAEGYQPTQDEMVFVSENEEPVLRDARGSGPEPSGLTYTGFDGRRLYLRTLLIRT
ncbi:MAG: winged helix-turn-helix transcriptional regulator [Spirochaetes bacterium]|nr:winged helix-turn-helix transcriptional regulator [Spirochaetota bacterium]